MTPFAVQLFDILQIAQLKIGVKIRFFVKVLVNNFIVGHS